MMWKSDYAQLYISAKGTSIFVALKYLPSFAFYLAGEKLFSPPSEKYSLNITCDCVQRRKSTAASKISNCCLPVTVLV